MTPGDRRNWNDSLLEGISLSCVNFILCFWFFTPGFQQWLNPRPAGIYALFTLLVVVVIPLLWTVVLNRLLRSRLLRGKVVSPEPTAWDRVFGKGEDLFVLVHLKNQELIGGIFGGTSSASTYPRKPDVYLAEVWKVSPEGKFESRVEQTRGLWIDKDFFDYLEFFSLTKEEEHGDGTAPRNVG